MHPTVRDVEVARLLKIIGQPDKKEPPDRIGQESCNDDGPSLPVFEQAQPRDFSSLCVHFIGITLNVSKLVSAKALLPFRHLVKRNPESQPDNPCDACHDERHLPAPGERNPRDDDRCDDCPKFEPELNKLVAKVRSLLGNQSATVLIDDGKLPASLIPRQMRAAKNPPTLDTNAWPMAARLQPVIEIA